MKNVIPVEEESNVYPMLRLMRGGKGPPESGGVNWLNGLDKGTAFSCKRKGNTDNLEIYIIAFKYDRTIILVDGLNNNHRIPVDPEDFCKKYIYWETIGKEEVVEPPVGVDNGKV